MAESGRCPTAQEARSRIVSALFGALTALTVFSVFYHNTRTSGGLSFVLILFCTAVTIGLLFAARHTIAGSVERIVGLFDGVSTTRFLTGACLAGLLLRIVWSLAIVPEQASDGRAYLQLAQTLLATGTYETSDGIKTHWPPGYPLFLLPFIAVFGNALYLPLGVNVLLFVPTVLLAFGLGRNLLGSRLARFPVLLLALWPSLIMGSGIANKEFLVAFLVTASAFCYVHAMDRQTRTRQLAFVGLSGLALGAAVLVQPSVLVLGFSYLLLELLHGRTPARSIISRLAVLAIAGALIISPWTIRNYLLMNAFIPVATNGPIVLWSANNDRATGGWIEADYDRFMKDEVAGSREALNEALTWIREHPRSFMVLTVKRLARFLGTDHGLAFSVPRTLYPESGAVDIAGILIGNAFWCLVIALIAAGALLHLGSAGPAPSRLGLPLFMILLLLAVHGVFQSEDRHRLNVISMLAILASACAFPSAASRPPARETPSG